MPETRSGQSYNSMEQASHNPSSSNPINAPTQRPITVKQQLDQLSQTLGTILHDIGNSEDEREVQFGGGRRRAHKVAPMQFHRPDARLEPLGELTKRMKVEVSDFLGKLDPDAFQDWVTALKDYFDWFLVPEDRKVRFVKLKLKGPACAWWSNWEEMKQRLESKYLPINYDQLIYEDMLQWKQGPKILVDQYTERFHVNSIGRIANKLDGQIPAVLSSIFHEFQ
ncbi:hypothetical protein ACOSQ4_033075 [Xanthoceras sorbifolium]